MTRKEARELMMQTIFQMDAQNNFDKDCGIEFFMGKNIGDQKNYLISTHENICNHLDEIDERINKYSRGWKTTRMPKVDLAIIRLAVSEILYIENIPTAVSINEAVDLAKIYGTEESPKYINAILGKVASENE